MIQEILKEWEAKYPCVNIKAKKEALEKFELSILRCGCQNCNLLKDLEKSLKRVEKESQKGLHSMGEMEQYAIENLETECERIYGILTRILPEHEEKFRKCILGNRK